MDGRGQLPDILPARHRDLEVAEFEAELVVYDPRCNKVHRLIDLAAVVFDACDGATEADQLLSELIELTCLDASAAELAIADTIEKLRRVGVLTGVGDGPRPP